MKSNPSWHASILDRDQNIWTKKRSKPCGGTQTCGDAFQLGQSLALDGWMCRRPHSSLISRWQRCVDRRTLHRQLPFGQTCIWIHTPSSKIWMRGFHVSEMTIWLVFLLKLTGLGQWSGPFPVQIWTKTVCFDGKPERDGYQIQRWRFFLWHCK